MPVVAPASLPIGAFVLAPRRWFGRVLSHGSDVTELKVHNPSTGHTSVQSIGHEFLRDLHRLHDEGWAALVLEAPQAAKQLSATDPLAVVRKVALDLHTFRKTDLEWVTHSCVERDFSTRVARLIGRSPEFVQETRGMWKLASGTEDPVVELDKKLLYIARSNKEKWTSVRNAIDAAKQSRAVADWLVALEASAQVGDRLLCLVGRKTLGLAVGQVEADPVAFAALPDSAARSVALDLLLSGKPAEQQRKSLVALAGFADDAETAGLLLEERSHAEAVSEAIVQRHATDGGSLMILRLVNDLPAAQAQALAHAIVRQVPQFAVSAAVAARLTAAALRCAQPDMLTRAVFACLLQRFAHASALEFSSDAAKDAKTLAIARRDALERVRQHLSRFLDDEELLNLGVKALLAHGMDEDYARWLERPFGPTLRALSVLTVRAPVTTGAVAPDAALGSAEDVARCALAPGGAARLWAMLDHANAERQAVRQRIAVLEQALDNPDSIRSRLHLVEDEIRKRIHDATTASRMVLGGARRNLAGLIVALVDQGITSNKVSSAVQACMDAAGLSWLGKVGASETMTLSQHEAAEEVPAGASVVIVRPALAGRFGGQLEIFARARVRPTGKEPS